MKKELLLPLLSTLILDTPKEDKYIIENPYIGLPELTYGSNFGLKGRSKSQSTLSGKDIAKRKKRNNQQKKSRKKNRK